MSAEPRMIRLQAAMIARARRWLAPLLQMPRPLRRAAAVVGDGLMCILAVWLAYAIRVGGWNLPLELWLELAVITLSIWYPVAIFTHVYRALIRFSGARTMFNLLVAIAVYSLPLAFVFLVITVPGVPRTFGALQPIIFFGLLSGSRLSIRFLLVDLVQGSLSAPAEHRVLIYGAGRAGQQLAQSLRAENGVSVLGFIDDDLRLDGQRLDGLRVFGADRLDRVINDLRPEEVLIALPSASRARRRDIIAGFQHYRVRVRSLPSVGNIVKGRVSVNDLREVQIEELLGRDPVAPNELLMSKTLYGKVVLVTGAGGSIGSELCRQILPCRPSRLVLLEQSEFGLFAIQQEVTALAGRLQVEVELVAELANVADGASMQRIFRRYRPETVFHAAAYKHVPMVEANPLAGVRNNILGTWRCVEAAEAVGVANFILVSTDKAVRPTNIMGTTKRVCEQILQARADAGDGSTVFSMVRFGNVLGSSGSVVPRFREQIAAGGPITLTHRDITRYFMTIPEAAQLVIQASALARGGDVFLLDMGAPIRIYDLAAAMIRLSGLSVRDADHPDGDIAIEEIGLRPGEKLYEELLIDEQAVPTIHRRIMSADEQFVSFAKLEKALILLETELAEGDIDAIMRILHALVPEYRPDRHAQAN